MKILAIERDVPGTSDEDFSNDLLEDEALCAWKLHQSGEIRELYFRSDVNAAVLVLECESTERARAVLGTLPLVRKGLIDFEVIPLVAYPGFERLFKK